MHTSFFCSVYQMDFLPWPMKKLKLFHRIIESLLNCQLYAINPCLSTLSCKASCSVTRENTFKFVTKVIIIQGIATVLISDKANTELGKLWKWKRRRGLGRRNTLEEDPMYGTWPARARGTAVKCSWHLVLVKVKVVWLRATLPHDEAARQ